MLEWTAPHARWFSGGQLNVAANCVDRHLSGARRNKAAIIWEGEPGDRRVYTYWELGQEVGRCASALKGLGVLKGDRVAIYLPMIPEAAIAMLACARIGAVHSVVFGGFSAEALRDRINDAECTVLITADGGYRRGSVLPLKRFADEAIEGCPTIRHVVVVRRRPGGEGDEAFATMREGRDHWWHRLLEQASPVCPAEPMDAEDMLFILYTSGHHREAEGHRAHHRRIPHARGRHDEVRLRPEGRRRLLVHRRHRLGHRTLLRGVRPARERGDGAHVRRRARLARARPLLEDLRALRRHRLLHRADGDPRLHEVGTGHPARHDLSQLRLLGSVGEPINPEAWMWYREHIGGSRCPIVDTWWQTETGGIMITPLPGVVTTKPGSATIPFPGIAAKLVDVHGTVLEKGGGFLVLTEPWPGMLRTIYGDDARYRETYWSRFPGRYFAGDGAKVDDDGYWWILGRVDDVLNVAGHRIGTMEVESALVDHPAVAEAAVVGKAHDLKGQAIAAFVTLKEGHAATAEMRDDLKEHVAKKIGAIARPDDILFSADLPKTRSGKIMRRLLRDIAEGRALGDTTTLADPGVVARLREMYEAEES